MSTNKEFPMTLRGKLQLETELERLIKVEREQLKVAIAEARAHGDLRENADYQAAKEKQSHIEGRILDLQGKLGGARVIDVAKLQSSKIVFGASVDLEAQETGNHVSYQIVGEDEAKEGGGKISYLSPLAKALLGKEEGDEVVVKAPKGDIHYIVEKISFNP